MAYLVRKASGNSEAAAASYTPVLPEHESGDLIMCCVTQDGGGTTIATATSGWAAIGTQAASGGARQGWFYKIAASSSETDPTFSGTNDDWTVQTVIVKDADATTPIHANARSDWNAVEEVNSPSLTTTNTECLLFYSWCSDGVTEMVFDTNLAVNVDKTFGTGQASIVAYTQQQTAGAVPTVLMTHEAATEGGNAWVIAINNASGGSRDIAPKSALSVMNYFGSLYSTTAAVDAAANSVLGLMMIDGLGMSATLPTVLDTGVSAVIPWGNVTTLTCADVTATNWQGSFMTLRATTDLSSKPLAFYLGVGTKATNRLGAKGIIMVVVDSLNNWAAYTLLTYKQVANNGTYDFVLNPSAMTPLDASMFAPDLTDIVQVGFLTHRLTTSTYAINLANLVVLETCTIVGGGVDRPLKALDLETILNNDRFYRLTQTQGAGQALLKQPLQLGNGTDATYVDLGASSIEVATPSRQYTVEDNTANITIYGSASDTFNLAGCILATTQANTFTIHASSSASADYDFSGAVLSGWAIVHNTAGITINGATLTKNRGITLNGGLLSGCAISASQNTPAVTTNNPENITDCAFTSAGTGHAITITATGTFDFTGNTFSGYGADATTDAAVYNNSGGAVTLVIPSGGQVPTIRNGAGASTTIDTPVDNQQVTVNGIITGSRIQIYDVTSSTELVNTVVASGTTYTWTDSSPYAADREIRLRLAYYEPTTARILIDQTIGTSTAADPQISFLASQVVDDVYVTNAVDGATITGVDFTDSLLLIEVDATEIALADIYAYQVYWLFTEAGIRDEAMEMTAIDPANYVINAFKIKNVSSPVVRLKITGGYFIDSVSREPEDAVDFTGGSIFLTPPHVVGYAVAGITGEMTTNINAIKTKTDNLPTDPAKESSVQLSIGLSA